MSENENILHTANANSLERRLYYNAEVGRPIFERRQLGESKRERPGDDEEYVQQSVDSSET
jgi:hypothetical protein